MESFNLLEEKAGKTGEGIRLYVSQKVDGVIQNA